MLKGQQGVWGLQEGMGRVVSEEDREEEVGRNSYF